MSFLGKHLVAMNALLRSTLLTLLSGVIAHAATPSYRVAIIDSHFCGQKFYSQRHHLRTHFPLEKKGGETCAPLPQKTLASRAFHGHQLLLEVTRELPSSKGFEFYLLNVFDKKGEQDPGRWKRAVTFANANAVDLVVTASGYFKGNQLQKEIFQGPLLAAAGNAVGPLAHRPRLFPQSSPSPQKYLVGSFHLPTPRAPGKKPQIQGYSDPLNMNRPQIRIFMPGKLPGRILSGSSLAVALAANFFLRHCAPQLSVEKCLEEKSVFLLLEGGEAKNALQHPTFPNKYYQTPR